MAKHSPATWICSENGAIIYSEPKAMSTDGGVAIICMKTDPQEAIANRVLISAAPDLLVALEAMVAAFSPDLYRQAAAVWGKADAADIAYSVACTAIAKATQEVPQ